MNNIVTFETAKRLKEAGFPQPEPATGQHWYRQSGGIAYIDFVDSDGEVFALLNGEVKGCQNFESAIFAPSATDILREMQKRTRKWFSWILTPPYKTATTWRCYGFEKEEGADFYVEHENPAEACAPSWPLAL